MSKMIRTAVSVQSNFRYVFQNNRSTLVCYCAWPAHPVLFSYLRARAWTTKERINLWSEPNGTQTNTHAQALINLTAFRNFRARHGIYCKPGLRCDLRTDSTSGAVSCNSAEKRPEPPVDDANCRPQMPRRPSRTQLLQNCVLVVCQRIRGQVASTAGRCCCCSSVVLGNARARPI